jgi:hypothetical protein
MFKRSLVLFSVVFLAMACNPSGGTSNAYDMEVGLLALDFSPMAEPLRSSDQLPTHVWIHLDDVAVATVVLGQPHGLLEGHAALPVAAGTPVDVHIRARFADGTESLSRARVINIVSNGIVRIPVKVSPALQLHWGVEEVFSLPDNTQLSVYFAERLRQPLTLSDSANSPTRAIAAILRDPQVASVAPFTVAPSRVDEIGSLVALTPVSADAAVLAPEPATPAQPTPAAITLVSLEITNAVDETPASEGEAGSSNAASAVDFISYYSYCTCGRSVVNHAYRLRAIDGRELDGQTDRFGMVLVRNVKHAQVDYGPEMKDRTRSYEFVADSQKMHTYILSALTLEQGPSKARINEHLTALLDLRRMPLEEARGDLVAKLDHPNPVIWRNAAVTLSYYADIDDVVQYHAERLASPEVKRDSEAVLRHLTILGALRNAAAVPVISAWLTHTNTAVRQVAVYGLGFIGHTSSLQALHALADDADPVVRAEVALALGRIGSDSSLQVLDTLRSDAVDAVVQRADEAIFLLTF